MTDPAPSYTCVCCGAVSYHADDVSQQYCARCHWWTGDPELGPPHLKEPCEARTRRAELIDRIADEELPRYAESFQRLADDPD